MRKYADNVSISPIAEGFNPGECNAVVVADGIVRRSIRRVGLWLKLWHQRRRSRRALDRLTAGELKDIGITRHDARNEYRKSLFIE